MIDTVEVRVFAMTDCPIARKYVPELRKLAAEYRGRVTFRALTVDEGDAQQWRKEFAIPFAVLRDPDGREACKRGVVAVPTAVLLRNGRTVYFGRIDDRFPSLGIRRPVRRRDLKVAIDETLAGKRVTTPRLRAVGCLLPPVAAASPIPPGRSTGSGDRER